MRVFVWAAFIAPLISAQIAVGPTVQVSRAHAEDTHFEVFATAHPRDPSRLIAASFLYREAAPPQTVVYTSTDGGATWQPSLEGNPLDYTGDPALAFGPQGDAYYIASMVPATGTRQMLSFRSADGGLHWGKATVFTYTDRQYVSVDSSGGKFNGRVYVNGNNRIPKDVSDIVLFTSTDQGASFQGPTKREGFGKFHASEMGNAVVASDGTLIATFVEGKGPWTLKAIRSTDGGATFDIPIDISGFIAGGQRKGAHNNANALPVLAVDGSTGRFRDRLYVAWPDRSGGHSQILFSSSSDLGRTWSRPRIINDRPTNDQTDDFMPALAINRDGILGMLWYDRRHHADNLGWDARFTASIDGGATFLPSVAASSVGTSFGPGAKLTALRTAVDPATHSAQVSINNFTFIGGDTAGLAADASGIFHPVWVGNPTGVPQLWTAAIAVLPEAVDLTSKVKIELGRTDFDRATGILTVDCSIENISEQPLRGPFRVHAANVKSELADVSAMADVLVSNATLDPKQKSSFATLQFRLSQLKPFADVDHVRLGLLRMDLLVYGSLPR